MQSQYRHDINGLRAIAVLAVVIFHINEFLLPGGFVGVDIFFVISGFLISQQLFSQIHTGTFSLKTFYIKRIARIIPAMLGVVALSVIAAQWFFTPLDAEKVAASGFWSTLSLGNLYFWLFEDTGYFAASSLEVPLLHLWSLGVEEQFYVFWPLLMMACAPFLLHRKFAFIMLGIILVSTVLAQALFESHHSFVYYMLPTRAGELLVGAMAAYYVIKNPSRHRLERIALPLQMIGLGMIGLSIAMFDHTTVFPGIASLLPTIGTALVLFAGHYKQTTISKHLSSRPMAFFGLISYSLYLYHWPVLAFYRYGNNEVGFISGILLFLVMVGLAILSHKFIEERFRHSRFNLFETTLRYFVIPAGLLLVFCAASMKLDGTLLKRYLAPAHTYQFGTHQDYIAMNDMPNICQENKPSESDFSWDKCVTGDNQSYDKKVVLLGDSNAAHYEPAIRALASRANAVVKNMFIGKCPFVKDKAELYSEARRIDDCKNFVPKQFELSLSADIIIVSQSYIEYQDNNPAYMDAFASTIETLVKAGKDVVLIGGIPRYESFSRHCVRRSIFYPGMECNVPDAPMDYQLMDINAYLENMAHVSPSVYYFDVNDFLCNDGVCSMYDESGKPLYYDPSHFSVNGANAVGKKWARSLPKNHTLIELLTN